MKEKEFGDLLLRMMQDKELVTKSLMDCLTQCQKTSAGCQRVVENWDTISDNPADLEKQLLTAIKTNQRLADTLMQVLILQMAYVMGGQYATDAAQTLNKMGRGQEAVREMFQSKMRGGK